MITNQLVILEHFLDFFILARDTLNIVTLVFSGLQIVPTWRKIALSDAVAVLNGVVDW